MAETTDDLASGLMIGAVFSLADSPVKSTFEGHGNASEGNLTHSRLNVIRQTNEQDIALEGNRTPTTLNAIRQSNEQAIEQLLNSSPVPIKKCSVRVDNFIEKDIRNKITEACNNAIVKQEPGEALANEKIILTDSAEIVRGDSEEQQIGRPTRKRKPNSLLSSEFLFKREEIAEFQKLKNRKKSKPEVTCQIDHDLVMTVAEKCLPEVVEKTEHKEDIKMVSILPPTLQININDTPVVIDWQEKVKIPEDEVKFTRPQTARTKKKLRTQEQIDKDNAEMRKGNRLKQKSKAKKKKSKMDPSPPHLEPYGGEFLDNCPSTDTPGSPGFLPPQLKPYDIGVNDERKKKPNKADTESPAMPHLFEVLSTLETNKSHMEKEDINRIPCSLTGRMRKPNQQFEHFLLSDVVKGARPSPKTKQANIATQDKNATINHENNTVQVTMLPNKGKHTDVSSKTIPNIYNSVSQFNGSQTSVVTRPGNANVTSTLPHTATPQTASATSNTKLTNAIGELAKIENTKKFFQLVVGDKIVLIPTDGNNVVPKAFVMDLAASQPGSSIAQSAKSKLSPSEPSSQKTFFMNVGGKPTTLISQGEAARNVQSQQVLSVIPQQPTCNTNNTQNINRVVIRSKNVPNVIPKQQTTTLHQPNILQRPIVSQPALKCRLAESTPGEKVILPIVSSITQNKTFPYPTNIITNNSTSTTTTFTPTTVVHSSAGNSNSQNTVSNTAQSSVGKLTPSSWSNVAPSFGTKVKQEPNNMKDYEKAVEAFKGVPDSETESDEETKKAQNKGPKVPEVGSHVPASESVTAEKIRKLKEKLKQQQMEVENLRKKIPAKDEENDTNS